MKNNCVKFIVFVSLVFISSVVFGQQSPTPAQAGGPQRSEKVEALKTAFITKQLDLSPAEAEKFWPVYDQYQKEIQALNKNRMANTNNMKPDIDNMSDADVSKMIENELVFEQQQLDIRKKYTVQFEKVLSIKKVAKLFQAEIDFKKFLLQQMSRDGGGGNRFRSNGGGQ